MKHFTYKHSNQYQTKEPFIKLGTWHLIGIILVWGICAAVIVMSIDSLHAKQQLHDPRGTTGVINIFENIAYAQSKTSPTSPTPTPSKYDIVMKYEHGDIIWRIYGLESSFGQEPLLYCTKRGLVSDMGYNALNHQCFDSFEQEVSKVNDWIEQHKGLALGKMLCLYNEGNSRLGCEYSNNFLTL